MKAKAIGGFVLLFILYHSAEWMYMKYQSASGFLVFQFLFFLSSLVIAKLQFKEGFAAWGFVRRGFWKFLLGGMLLGLTLYGTALGLNVWWAVEEVVRWPQISAPLGLFIFGNFLSSISEDILTRAYLFKHWDFPWMYPA